MCGGAKWKREVVPDHKVSAIVLKCLHSRWRPLPYKFDFIDTREFTDNGFMMRMK